MRGELRTIPPFVFGHEGAGIVEAVGSNVPRFKPGDYILVNWLPVDDTCPTCLAGQPFLCERLGRTTFQGLLPDGTTWFKTADGVVLKQLLSSATMAEYTVIDQAGAIPVPADVPLPVAAILGCAVVTGVGAVISTAQARAGSAAAVVGCGGVGLSALQGCRLAGCFPIIAAEVLDSKLEFAKQMRATEAVNVGKANLVKALRELTRVGSDYAFDTVGSATTIGQALQASAPGGTAVVVGLHAAKADVLIPAGALVFQNKRLLGSFAGSMRPQIDLPRLVQLYRVGRLALDPLITKRYRLTDLA